MQLADINHNMSKQDELKPALKHSGTDNSISSISTRCTEGSISSKSSKVGSFWRSSSRMSGMGPKSGGRVCCNDQPLWIQETWCGPRSKGVDELDNIFNEYEMTPAAKTKQGHMESSETP